MCSVSKVSIFMSRQYAHQQSVDVMLMSNLMTPSTEIHEHD